jgi:capsid portal protein
MTAMSDDKVSSFGDDAVFDRWTTEDGYEIKATSFSDGSARSQQVDPDEGIGVIDNLASDELLDTDYDPMRWAAAPEMSTRLRSSIRIAANNVGGLSWEITPIKNEAILTPEEEAVVETQSQIIKEVFDTPNPKIPLRTVLYRCWYDRKAVGTGLLEITRNGVGRIDGIYHLQSKHMRRLKRGGWRQTKNSIKRYFKDFGDESVINVETGVKHDGPEPLPRDMQANETISFVEYSSDVEPEMGVPPHAAASKAISGNYYAASRNMNMQRIDATPRVIIALEGGELSDQSEKSIRDFLNAAGRNEQDMRSNRIMVLSIQKASQSSSEKTGIQVHPLTVGSKEDATFQVYRKNNDEEIREAFSIAALFYGSTEGTNRASASVARHVTIEQAFNPEMDELEYRVNHTLVKDILGKRGYDHKSTAVQFNLIRPAASDEVERSEVLARYANIGGFSPNDIRRHLRSQGENVELWKGAWAELPLFIILGLVKAGYEPSAMGLDEAGVEDAQHDDNATPEEKQMSVIKQLGIDLDLKMGSSK